MIHRVLLAGVLAVLAGAAGPLAAQDLAGEWHFRRPARNGTHAGMVVIDERGEARLRAQGPVQAYAQCGQTKVAGEKVEIVFSSVRSVLPYSLDHFYCTRPGDDVLSCYNEDGIGREDQLFDLRRVGDGTGAAARRLDDVCPARISPQA